MDFGLPVAPILEELGRHSGLWDQHKARTTAPDTPHKTSSDIWVRYNDAGPFERGERPWAEFNDLHIPVWYPAWTALKSLQPIVWDLMRAVEGEMLCGVLITKIPPGGVIEPHADDSWHVQFTEKFYLSLQNDPGAEFVCHDDPVEALSPTPGEVWLFDNRKIHSVRNKSTRDRITVIICIRTALFGRY